MQDNLKEINEEIVEKDELEEGRPFDIPEKFWDMENKKIKSNELLKSYKNLEKKLSSTVKFPDEEATDDDIKKFLKRIGVPETSEEYNIEIKKEVLGSDPKINEKLHSIGLNNDQVQAFYDIVCDDIVPFIQSIHEDFKAQHEIQKLHNHFGSKEKFDEVAKQIDVWASKKLSEDVHKTLTSSYDGVISLYNMMNSSEPYLIARSEGKAYINNEKTLRNMMNDPRYWRDKNPEYIKKVTDGYEMLYSEE